MKKIIGLIIVIWALLWIPNVQALKCAKKINVYLFWRTGCPWCEGAIKFLEGLKTENEKCFSLKKYNVGESSQNSELMNQVGQHFNQDVRGVPYIVIGEETFNGYTSSYDAEIKKAIETAANNSDYTDVVATIQGGSEPVSKNDKTVNSIITVTIIAVALVGVGLLARYANIN